MAILQSKLIKLIRSNLCYESLDGKHVRHRLVLNTDDADGEMLLGFVLKTPKASTWWWTAYNTDISCASDLSHTLTEKEAKRALKQHCIKELVRIYSLGMKDFVMDDIHRLYKDLSRKSDKVFADSQGMTEAEFEAFKLGVAYAHAYSGMPRAPEWAKFVVQNQDGRIVHHKKKPLYEEGEFVKRDKCKRVALAKVSKHSLQKLPRFKE